MNLISLCDNIIALQKDAIPHWKTQGIEYLHHDFLRIVEENHAFNYQLWHAEDRARREDLGPTFVYQAKRDIDHYNQQRNNRMESMDSWLFQYLEPTIDPECPIHSETPGMMIDRLSILALKAYHMSLQVERTDVDDTHRQGCLLKYNTLNAQLKQLHHCLLELLTETKQKSRTFRIYHQFKMYNDPTLNPELYRSL